MHYPNQDPVPTGMKGRCPRCGEGALFSGLLTVKDHCTACQMSFEFDDSGDGPTVFIIMGLGFIVLGAALFVELNYAPPTWLHFLLWPPLVFLLGLPALRMLKGVLIALQYQHDAAQGELDQGDEAKSCKGADPS